MSTLKKLKRSRLQIKQRTELVQSSVVKWAVPMGLRVDETGNERTVTTVRYNINRPAD